jgi:peptidoglycan/LPS O-acetylase OafA/YrhL
LLLAGLAGKQAFSIVYTLTIAYMLCYLAYLPAGAIRKYNEMGDYSYGVYIYAFPVQQALAATYPGISVSAMLLSSGMVTLALAILSWHLIEKRALRLKGLPATVSSTLVK